MSGIVVGDCGKHDGASLYYERVADVLVLMGWLLSELYSQITSGEAQAWLYGQREGPCRRTDANASQPKLKAALTFDVPTSSGTFLQMFAHVVARPKFTSLFRLNKPKLSSKALQVYDEYPSGVGTWSAALNLCLVSNSQESWMVRFLVAKLLALNTTRTRTFQMKGIFKKI
jgi:hypothetical protein